MDPRFLSIGQSILIRRSDGRVHSAAISGIDSGKKFISVEWFENNETKGKEIDFESVYELNKNLFKTSNLQDKVSYPPSSQANAIKGGNRLPTVVMQGNDRRTVVTPKENRATVENRMPRVRGPENLGNGSFVEKKAPKGRDHPVSWRGEEQLLKDQDRDGGRDVVPSASKDSKLTAGGVANKSRKSNCVKEVERLKKNREERRAKQAEQVAMKYEDCDNIPNWEFYQKIEEFRSKIQLNPLVGDEPVSFSKICVCVRKRPLNKKEVTRKEIDVVTVHDKSSILVHEPKQKVDLTKYLENQHFTFDFSFDEHVPNEIVYKYTAQPLVHTVFDRGMATCFAYGQTGSGKTHTMGGVFSGKDQDATRGIYALAAADIFALNSTPGNVEKELSIHASFFEIYGGKVFDLMNNKAKLRILEDGKQQVQIVGLAEEKVENVKDVLKLIQIGNSCRTSGTTSANQHSSRSHAVFQIIVRRKAGGRLYGKFSLIDLAGNERGADTANSDRLTRMEGAEINRSLLALKECIRALGRKGAHLPFRGSKLTLVLKDSFVGENSRTCMIAMISPGFNSCEHTLNTLRYADRVKELRSGGGVMVNDPHPLEHSAVGEKASVSESGSSDADLQYLHRSLRKEEGGELDMNESSEILTFHEAISNLVESEEQLVEEHKAIIQADQYLLEEEKRLLEYVDSMDHDIEQYVTHMERIVSQKVERLSKFKERIQDLKQRLQEEERASRKVKRLPMP